jgi:hypothetical protein
MRKYQKEISSLCTDKECSKDIQGFPIKIVDVKRPQRGLIIVEIINKNHLATSLEVVLSPSCTTSNEVGKCIL